MKSILITGSEAKIDIILKRFRRFITNGDITVQEAEIPEEEIIEEEIIEEETDVEETEGNIEEKEEEPKQEKQKPLSAKETIALIEACETEEELSVYKEDTRTTVKTAYDKKLNDLVLG